MSKPEIETLASREIYRNRWMSLREDSIRRADGSEGMYSVVAKPDFAVIAAVEAGYVHLVEQYRYPVQARFWELPQGSLEGDADPLTVAKTELAEETGIVAANMAHVGKLFLAYGYSSQGYDVFLATGLTQGAQQLEAGEQGLITRAFPIETVEQMIRDGVIRDATTVAAIGLLRLKSLI